VKFHIASKGLSATRLFLIGLDMLHNDFVEFGENERLRPMTLLPPLQRRLWGPRAGSVGRATREKSLGHVLFTQHGHAFVASASIFCVCHARSRTVRHL
jgi:hypothetical protein